MIKTKEIQRFLGEVQASDELVSPFFKYHLGMYNESFQLLIRVGYKYFTFSFFFFSFHTIQIYKHPETFIPMYTYPTFNVIRMVLIFVTSINI